MGKGSSRSHSADSNYISHGRSEKGIRRRLPILLEWGLHPVYLHATAVCRDTSDGAQCCKEIFGRGQVDTKKHALKVSDRKL